MWNSRKSVMLSLIITYVFMVLLVIGMVVLPMLVTWYVEYKGREASLPTTIMLTLYPCSPFAATALWSLRGVFKGILEGNTFTAENVIRLKRISWCAFAVMAVMLYSGRFYLPFYVCAMCAAFIGLILRVFKNIIEGELPIEEKKSEAAVETSEASQEDQNTVATDTEKGKEDETGN